MIRLWKLGDHKAGYVPETKGVDKLIEILKQDEEGQVLDIVWDSMLDLTIIQDDGTVMKG